jgi:hypothetical protein
MRFAKALQPDGRNAPGKPKKSRLHVSRESGDLCGDGFVQDFDSPRHGRLYLNFEIEKRGKLMGTPMNGGLRFRPTRAKLTSR